jgi:hypothetical protein
LAGGVLLAVMLLLVGGLVVPPRLTRPDLKNIDLAPLLTQPGDLPTGMTGGQIGTTLPGMDGNIARPTNMVYQELAEDGRLAGRAFRLCTADIPLTCTGLRCTMPPLNLIPY